MATPALSPSLGFVLTEAVSSVILKGGRPFPGEHFKYNYRGDSDSKIHFTKHFPFYLKAHGWCLSGAKHLADLISSRSCTNQITMTTGATRDMWVTGLQERQSWLVGLGARLRSLAMLVAWASLEWEPSAGPSFGQLPGRVGARRSPNTTEGNPNLWSKHRQVWRCLVFESTLWGLS